MDEKQLNEADIHKEEETREIQPRHWNDPLAQVGYKGYWYSREEAPLAVQQHPRRQLAARKARRAEWLASEGGKLCMPFIRRSKPIKTM